MVVPQVSTLCAAHDDCDWAVVETASSARRGRDRQVCGRPRKVSCLQSGSATQLRQLEVVR